jgi:hypothetical protein
MLYGNISLTFVAIPQLSNKNKYGGHAKSAFRFAFDGETYELGMKMDKGTQNFFINFSYVTNCINNKSTNFEIYI